MSRVVPTRIARIVQERADGFCEYCFIHESQVIITFQVDHLVARSLGGTDDASNLAWLCPFCNRRKGTNSVAPDPSSGKMIFIYNPRRQKWRRHFRLENGKIIGKTPAARATVALLSLNDIDFVAARQMYFAANPFPL